MTCLFQKCDISLQEVWHVSLKIVTWISLECDMSLQCSMSILQCSMSIPAVWHDSPCTLSGVWHVYTAVLHVPTRSVTCLQFDMSLWSSCSGSCKYLWLTHTLLPLTALFSTLLHCTVLHCTELHWTALYCTVLHFTSLYFTTLHCTILYCNALHCTILHYTALHCFVLHLTVIHYTVLLCTALYFTVMHCTAL